MGEVIELEVNNKEINSYLIGLNPKQIKLYELTERKRILLVNSNDVWHAIQGLKARQEVETDALLKELKQDIEDFDKIDKKIEIEIARVSKEIDLLEKDIANYDKKNKPRILTKKIANNNN